MPVQLDHTIIPTRDKREAAAHLADVLALPPATGEGPFLQLQLAHGVTLAFADSEDVPAPRHVAFRVGEEELMAILDRLRDQGITHWADPFKTEPDDVHSTAGDLGIYWEDPDGHLFEAVAHHRGGAR